MQNTQRQLIEILHPSGVVSPMSLTDLRALVERCPYYHLARIALMRLLYDQRDPSFSDELQRAALFVPSRETLFHVVEGDSMRPEPQIPLAGLTGGATVAHKPNQRIDSQAPAFTHERTASLIDNFLNGLPQSVAEENGISTDAGARRPMRPADATTDYISYMLQEEEKQKENPIVEEQTVEEPAKEVQTVEAAEKNVKESSTDQMIDTFLQKKGDRRIRLKDKEDSELQKPVLEPENGAQKLAFTETLAHIYIKQKKFEQAIEIIRRLSLKNPEKNRYFADQIRFLEKLLVNQRAAKSKNV